MSERLNAKCAVVVGAGQTEGETIGNGRATAIIFAREGASVLCVDRVLEQAAITADMIRSEGGVAESHAADICNPKDAAEITDAALARFGRIDILVNNVGVHLAGDGSAHEAQEDALERTFDANFKGMWRTLKAAIPVMRTIAGASIVNISSLLSLAGSDAIAYETSKAAVNRLTISIADANAKYGLRCNAVLPGLMDTPMAIVGISKRTGQSAEETRRLRNARVPLRGQMGSAWDTAHAALFLASDEARFITGVLLRVDGGISIHMA